MGDEPLRRRAVDEGLGVRRQPRRRLDRADLGDHTLALEAVGAAIGFRIGVAEVAADHPHHVLGGDRVEGARLVGLDAREVRRELVVLLLRDRIALVVVAAHAAHGKAEERAADDIDDAVEIVREGLLEIRHLVVPHAESIDPRRDEAVEVAVLELVARELLEHEAVVGHVLVERLDHPVAVLPRPALDAVALEAVGLGVAHQVEPVPSPLLAVVRARKQTIEKRRPREVGVGVPRGQERLDLRGRRRQAGQVEVRAAKERKRIGFWRRIESDLLELREDEVVDLVAAPLGVPHHRRLRLREIAERPALAKGLFDPRREQRLVVEIGTGLGRFVGRQRVDPTADRVEFGFGQALALGRHRLVVVRVERDAMPEFARIEIACDDDPIKRRHVEDLAVLMQAKAGLRPVGAVALDAPGLEDRQDLGEEDRLGGFARTSGGIVLGLPRRDRRDRDGPLGRRGLEETRAGIGGHGDESGEKSDAGEAGGESHRSHGVQA